MAIIKKLFPAALICLLALAVTACPAGKGNVVTLKDGRVGHKVKGKVIVLNRRIGSFTIKNATGKKWAFTTDGTTTYKGLKSAADLKKRMPLEVIYLDSDASPFKTIRIRKMNEEECG